MRLIAVLLCLAFSGCATSPDEVWHGDVAFTAPEREAIEAGAAFTSTHVGKAPPVIVWDGPVAGERSITRSRPPAQDCPDMPDCVGFAWETAMWLAPDLEPSTLRTIAAHEWGHTYWLLHHDEPGLMQPRAEPSMVWTDADRKDCVANAHGDHDCT